MTPLIRKLTTVVDEIAMVQGQKLILPLKRVLTAAVIENPFAGRYEPKLDPLYELGALLGARLVRQAVAALGSRIDEVQSYGKAALVGLDGEEEHGAALLHPRFGKSVRTVLTHAKSIMPSTVKRAAAGASIDVPLHSVLDEWSFDHMDTATLTLHDAPTAAEILIVLALAERGRPLARITRSN